MDMSFSMYFSPAFFINLFFVFNFFFLYPFFVSLIFWVSFVVLILIIDVVLQCVLCLKTASRLVIMQFKILLVPRLYCWRLCLYDKKRMPCHVVMHALLFDFCFLIFSNGYFFISSMHIIYQSMGSNIQKFTMCSATMFIK